MQNENSLSATIVLRDELSGPVHRAQGELAKLGQSFQTLQQKANQSLKPLNTATTAAAASTGQMAASFDKAEKAQAQLTARFTRLTAAIIGLDSVSRALGSTFGKGALGGGLKAATDGLSTFAGIVGLMPNKIGLFVGAAAGLGVGLAGLIGPSEALRKNLEAVAKSLEDIRKQRGALAEAGERNRLEAGVRSDTGNPMTDVEKLERERDRLTQDLVALKRLKEQLEAAPLRAQLDDPEFGKNMERIREIEALTEKLRGLNAEIQRLTEHERSMKALDEVGQKVKALNQQSEDAKAKLEAGMIQPLEEAELQLKLTEKAVDELFAARELLGDEGFKDAFDHLANDAKAQRAKIENLKAQAKAQAEAERQMDQMRAEWDHFFDDIRSGFSEVFAEALVDGKDMAKGLGDVFKSLQRSLVKMAMDSVLGGAMRGIGNAFSSLLGGGGQAPAAPAPSSVNVQQQQSAGAWGLGAGNPYLGAAAGVGGGVGGYVMQRGISGGNTTQGAAGGALAGAAMGAIFGPVGMAVGAIAGAALGYFSANEAKEEEEKMKERQRAAEEEARRQHEEMVEKAKGLIKMHVRNNFSGGLGTEEAMSDISKLFSNDISAEEVEKFGAENVVARQAEIEGQAATNVDVGGIVINAQVSGSYDVERIAEDLGYYLRRSIPGA